MLVQIECPSSGRTSAVPSIMDSPTLARVERAMLRQEEGVHQQQLQQHRTTQHMHQSREAASLNRAALTQSLIPSNFGKETGYHAIKRGLLWQQRDRLFSRWKERYFVLTRDYLHCFRRASGTDHRVTEMGAFLFKVKLADVERVEWLNRRTYSAVSLELGVAAARDGGAGKLLLRASEGLEDWFELLEECTMTSKERRRALRMTTPQHFNHHQHHQAQAHQQQQHFNDFNHFKRNNNNSINSSLEEWLAARQKIPNIRNGTLQTDTMSTARGGTENGGSVGEDSVQLRRDNNRRWFDDSDTWTLQDNSDNRLSLLTDIDISSYDGTLEASSNDINDASMASYHRHNDDVFSVARRGVAVVTSNTDSESLRGSFRSASVTAVRRNGGSPHTDVVNKRPVLPLDAASQFIKFRERSHSDIQRIDRRPWHIRTEIERRAIYN